MMSDSHKASLPYINRPGLIAATIGINVVCLLISFGFRRAISENNFLINTFICGLTTTVIDSVYARYRVGKMRRAGLLPREVPTSRFILALPGNPAALVAVLGILFGLISYAVNYLVVRFFGITEYTLWRIIVWQALFACGLSSVVMQTVVLRLVQPDCAKPDDPEQNGRAEVLNPLPPLEALKSWFNAVTSDFGFNMLMGLVFGGVVIIDKSVVIYPTTLSGIAISSTILSLVVLLRMVYPVVKSIRSMRERNELPVQPRRNAFLSRLPDSPAAFTALMAVPIILVSYGALKGFLTLFNLNTLHFFQYFVIRTAYVALLTKATVIISAARYTQPLCTTKKQAI